MIIGTTPPQRFRIAPGSLVSIKPANDTGKLWKAYTTRKEAVGERVAGSSGAIVLKVGDWLILAKEHQAKPVSDG